MASAEAVGGEDLLDVLAQGGALPRQVAAGYGAGGGDQVLLQGCAAPVLTIEGGLQQMAQQRHHPLEDGSVPHRRHSAMQAAGPVTARRLRRQLNRRLLRAGTAEAVVLQPGQVAADGAHIAVTLAVKAGQVGGRPLGQIAFGHGGEQVLQLGGCVGIASLQIGVGDQQPDQIQEPLQVQQT